MVLTGKHSLDELYSQRGRNVSPPRVGDPSKSAELISFIYGFPDPESLPAKTVADAAVRALESNGQWALQYGATMGARPLVDVLLEKLARDPDLSLHLFEPGAAVTGSRHRSTSGRAGVDLPRMVHPVTGR